MAEIQLVRMPGVEITEAQRETIRHVLFGVIDGVGERNQRRWRRFWSRVLKLEPGEVQTIKTSLPRSGPFHRRHFAMEQAIFDAQERFEHLEQYMYWLKVGAGWVTWAAGPKGGVVPIPRSISYAHADEDEFREFHTAVVRFLRGPHAARYLWPHLKCDADEMMDSILGEFNE